MLALTFADKSDYDKILENDTFEFVDLNQFTKGKPLTITATHEDSSSDTIICNHTYNEAQIEWFNAGSALNLIHSKQG